MAKAMKDSKKQSVPATRARRRSSPAPSRCRRAARVPLASEARVTHSRGWPRKAQAGARAPRADGPHEPQKLSLYERLELLKAEKAAKQRAALETASGPAAPAPPAPQPPVGAARATRLLAVRESAAVGTCALGSRVVAYALQNGSHGLFFAEDGSCLQTLARQPSHLEPAAATWDAADAELVLYINSERFACVFRPHLLPTVASAAGDDSPQTPHLLVPLALASKFKLLLWARQWYSAYSAAQPACNRLCPPAGYVNDGASNGSEEAIVTQADARGWCDTAARSVLQGTPYGALVSSSPSAAKALASKATATQTASAAEWLVPFVSGVGHAPAAGGAAWTVTVSNILQPFPAHAVFST